MLLKCATRPGCGASFCLKSIDIRRDKQGPNGVLNRLNSEYVRRGRQLSARQLSADQVLQEVRANQGNTAPVAGVAAAGAAGHASAGPGAAAPVAAAPPPAEFQTFFAEGKWMARHIETGITAPLPPLAPTSVGYHQVTTTLGCCFEK